MKYAKVVLIAAAVAVMLFGVHAAHAQVATNQPSNPAFPSVEITGMTDIYDAANHTISGAAYFKNYDAHIATIGFTESLYFGTKEDFSHLEFIDSAVAPQTFSIAAGQTVRIPYSYTVPRNINTGDYVFRIRVLTQDSYTELAFLDENIHLTGAGSFLNTVPELSFITVNGKQYSLGEGVAFASSAQALLHITLQNDTAHTISGNPQATIRIRGANGTVVKTFTPTRVSNAGDPYPESALAVSPGQTVDYVVALPVLDPQVYVYSLSFADNTHNAIAPLTQGRYIIIGPSAKILSLSMDKNFYPAESMAVVSLAIIGPADGSTLPKDGTVEVDLIDNGKALQRIDKNVQLSAAEQNLTFNVPISQSWYNPSVQARIVYDGKVLDSVGQNLTSPNKPSLISMPNLSAGDWLFIGLGVIILGLIIALIVLRKKPKKTKLMHAVLIVMLLTGYLAAAHTIYASTQSTSSSANWWEGNTEYYGTITLQATVPDSVNVGSSLSVSGSVILNSCSNASFTGTVYTRISDYGNADSYYVSGRDSSPGSFYMTLDTSGESGGYHSVLVHAIGSVTFPQSGRTQSYDLLLTFSTNFVAPTHYACSGSSCAKVSGAGSDSCWSNADCSTPTYHNACQNNSCVSVSGSGSNQCYSNSDCYAPPVSHNICSNYSCISVNGSGSNQCYSNSSCGTPPPAYYYWNYTILPVDSSTGQVLNNAFYTFATSCSSSWSAQNMALSEWNNGQYIYGSHYVYTTCSNNADWWYFYTVSQFTQGSATYNYQSYSQSGSNGYYTIYIYYQKQPQYTVSVAKTGTGSGTVTSSYGMNCGNTCSEQINSGNTDYLYASPNANSTFSGWSGACSGTNTMCSLYVNSNKSVTATFTYNPPPPPTVSLTANPSSIYTGQYSSLSWHSTNATSCTASGAWSGNVYISGSLNIQPSSTSTYMLTCYNSAGTPASQSATVTVLPLSYAIGVTSSASGIPISSSVAGNAPYPYPSYYIVQNNPFSTVLSAPDIAKAYGGLYVFSTWAHDPGVSFTDLGLNGSNYRAQAAEYTGTQGFNASNRTVSARYTPYYFDISPAANPTSGIIPLAVNFSANPSTNMPQDLPDVTYLWNFSDGSTSTQQNPAHTFAQAGTYRVTLTATDVDASQVLGSTVTRTVDLTISANYANPQYKETTP
ncbi:PKD domain-containing protein [Patescibacteria group bacterium]|nr:PKD domain-containing protein [Patescibacteria group bacterium]